MISSFSDEERSLDFLDGSKNAEEDWRDISLFNKSSVSTDETANALRPSPVPTDIVAPKIIE